MWLDKRTEFCDAVALNTGAAGTYLIGSQIDLDAVRDIGSGQPLYLVAIVSATATSGGAATLELTLASDSTAAIDTGGAATEHLTLGPFAVADLTAGTVLGVVALPLEGNAYEQFLGILQVTGVAAFTAGAVDVFLTPDQHGWKAYPDGDK